MKPPLARLRALLAMGAALPAVTVLGQQAPPPPAVPPPSPAGPVMFPPQTTELTRKMNANRVLRELDTLRLSARELESTLPLFRELRDAEKTLQTELEQAVETERSALLAAGPGDPLPPSADGAMRAALLRYQAKQAHVFEGLAQAIGPEKATGMRSLAGPGGFAPPVPAAPEQGPGAAGGGPPIPRPRPFFGRPLITPAELVTLMETKLAAMRR